MPFFLPLLPYLCERQDHLHTRLTERTEVIAHYKKVGEDAILRQPMPYDGTFAKLLQLRDDLRAFCTRCKAAKRQEIRNNFLPSYRLPPILPAFTQAQRHRSLQLLSPRHRPRTAKWRRPCLPI